MKVNFLFNLKFSNETKNFSLYIFVEKTMGAVCLNNCYTEIRIYILGWYINQVYFHCIFLLTRNISKINFNIVASEIFARRGMSRYS